MRFLVSIFFLLLFFHGIVVAQQPYPSGLIMDDEEYDNLPRTSEHIKIDLGQRILKSRVDLSNYCPEVKHQGIIASCVGWSAGYSALTIERAIENGWTDKDEIMANANSAMFVFNQVSNGNCNAGIKISEALELMQDKGNCLAKEFDFNINDCSNDVPSSLITRASRHRIEEYLPLFKSSEEASTKVTRVKMLLAQNKPIIVGMRVLNNFYQIRPGDVSWLPTIGDRTSAGGHSMVVVGYDDNKFHTPLRSTPRNMRGAFKIMNSWGKQWGDRGFIWIRYKHFGEYCRQAYAVLLEDAMPIELDAKKLEASLQKKKNKPSQEKSQKTYSATDISQYAGFFEFKHYKGWNEGPVFENARVRLDNKMYYLDGDWKLNDKFQLSIKSGFEQGYIYVFSIDAAGKQEIHFPKEHQSALIWENETTLSIPGENSALSLKKKGKDYLIALFSTSKIKREYIELLSSELVKNADRLPQSLFELLNPYVVPASDIRYQHRGMGFEVSTSSVGKIIPIVLQVEVK